MPRRGRRRRFWAVPDPYPIFVNSIDSHSENAYGRDESRRHGPGECERCRYGSSGFLCEQPRGEIGRPCGTRYGNRPVEPRVEKEGYFSSAFRARGRTSSLIFDATVDATGKADRVTPD